MTKAELISYEEQVRELWEAGELPFHTHLCGGNEDFLINYFEKNFTLGDWVFASHRCHYSYLLSGGQDFIEKIKKGRSMFLYHERFICSAIVGGVLAIACGKALEIQMRHGTEKVFAFCGDGATDQGSFWEALRFAMGRNLPITFIVEDNGGQCGVSPETRWGDYWPMIQHSFRNNKFVRHYRYKPTHPHAGANGCDGKPTRPQLKWKPQ